MIARWLIAPSVALLAFASNAQAAPPMRCTFEHARYQTPAMTLSFADIGRHEEMLGDLAMRILDTATGREIAWYYFDEGTAPRVSLISAPDPTAPGWKPGPGGARPHGAATFLGMNADGAILQSLPTSGSIATDFIIIPELAGTGPVAQGRAHGSGRKRPGQCHSKRGLYAVFM